MFAACCMRVMLLDFEALITIVTNVSLFLCAEPGSGQYAWYSRSCEHGVAYTISFIVIVRLAA